VTKFREAIDDWSIFCAV